MNPKLDLNKLKVAIFDWDNTLAESRMPLVFAINKVLEEYKMPDWNIVKKRRNPDLSFWDNFPVIFGTKAAEAYMKYSKIYLKNVADLISTFEYATEVLTLLKKRGIKIVVVTNKDRKLLDNELPLLFDKNLFDKVVAGHEAPRDKPYPEHAWFALQPFMDKDEITPESVWVIGDTPQDSKCALSINAQPIRISKSIWGDDNENENENEVIHFDTFYALYNELKG